VKKNGNSKNWNNDYIQFGRLLSEIYAVGLREDQYADLCESMNLDKSYIKEIFERAEAAWDISKLDNL
jgi:hypothetical protein